MVNLELKKHRDNFEVNVFYKKGDKSFYRNILDRDSRKISQILLDLETMGFKIDKAVSLYLERKRKKDWLGF